jgi:hypothetical protein
MSAEDATNWADGHIDWVVSHDEYEQWLREEQNDLDVSDEDQSDKSEGDSQAGEEANMADEEDVSCPQDSV